MMNKKEIRRQFSARRMTLALQQMHEAFAAILEQVQTIQLPNINYWMSFKAMQERNEVPIHLMDELLIESFPEAVLCFPQANFSTGEMQAIEYKEDLEWQIVNHGVEQPVEGKLIDPLKLDLVLVPLLAFDLNGYRVGYGKGFYDRFLSRCRPDVLKIGLSFFEPISAIDDRNVFDVTLTYCATPQKLYVF